MQQGAQVAHNRPEYRPIQRKAHVESKYAKRRCGSEDSNTTLLETLLLHVTYGDSPCPKRVMLALRNSVPQPICRGASLPPSCTFCSCIM